MSEITKEIVQFCAEEVERQGRGPIQVAWMVEAWMIAMHQWQECLKNKDSLQLAIMTLGAHVEDRNPMDKWRGVGVRVGHRICPSPAEVPDLMSRWASSVLRGDMTAEDAYRELMLIHPFVDGNGRVGKIVYNALKGTLDKPQMPPNFFNCANP